jgi:hypothetical protein
MPGEVLRWSHEEKLGYFEEPFVWFFSVGVTLVTVWHYLLSDLLAVFFLAASGFVAFRSIQSRKRNMKRHLAITNDRVIVFKYGQLVEEFPCHSIASISVTRVGLQFAVLIEMKTRKYLADSIVVEKIGRTKLKQLLDVLPAEVAVLGARL